MKTKFKQFLSTHGRTLALVGVLLPLLALFIYVGLRAGPLAPRPAASPGHGQCRLRTGQPGPGPWIIWPITGSRVGWPNDHAGNSEVPTVCGTVRAASLLQPTRTQARRDWFKASRAASRAMTVTQPRSLSTSDSDARAAGAVRRLTIKQVQAADFT